MRANTSSPGVSGPQRVLCRWGLTTRDGVRQETPGALGRADICGSQASSKETRMGQLESKQRSANVNVTLAPPEGVPGVLRGKEFPCPLCGAGLPILN